MAGKKKLSTNMLAVIVLLFIAALVLIGMSAGPATTPVKETGVGSGEVTVYVPTHPVDTSGEVTVVVEETANK